MGIFSRTRDIFAANITELLDRSEDPAKMIRMVILEMEETLVEVRASAARCIADGKEMRRALSRLDELQKSWTEKAELALSKDREDLAKAALIERQKAADMADGLRAEIETIRPRPREGSGEMRADIVNGGSRPAAGQPSSAIVVMSLHERRFGDSRQPLMLLSATVGVLLLIACANIANLSLARATSREREFSLRLALGAGRGRVVRYVMCESAVLALAVTWALCRLLHRIGLYRWIWHRHLFDLGLYAMVFAAVTFIASRSLG